VCLAVGLLLLIAAGLKAYDLATSPILGAGILQSRWFLIGVVEFELLLGLWLLSGVYPAHAWAVSLGCFLCFGCVTLHKALSGEASCGCFGRVEVNPWVTLGLDVLVVASLLRWRPARREFRATGFFPRQRSSHVVRIVAIWLAMGIPIAAAIVAFRDASLTEGGELPQEGTVVVLKPETWAGQRFPLLRFIDIGDDLAHGEWLVVLYRHDCAKCQLAIRAYGAFESSIDADNTFEGIALVEVPPYGVSRKSSGVCSHGKLSDATEWFVRTPLEVHLYDGNVTSVRLVPKDPASIEQARVKAYGSHLAIALNLRQVKGRI